MTNSDQQCHTLILKIPNDVWEELEAIYDSAHNPKEMDKKRLWMRGFIMGLLEDKLKGKEND